MGFGSNSKRKGLKFESRYASLSTESLTFYKKPSDSMAIGLIPAEKITTAEIDENLRKKGRIPIKITVEGSEPVYIALDNFDEAEQLVNDLKRCKTKREIQQWLINPSTIKLEKEIGCGAFGKVWRGTMSGTPVAIKEMRQASKEEEIEKEIHLLSKIHNPNCVRLLGIYKEEDKGKLFIVTEFIEGGDLHDVVERSGRILSEEIKLKIIRDVARGVAFLHENHIIHRDLKTDNVLIRSTAPGASQYAVVADFGISKFAPNLGSAGAMHTLAVGTPVYMAPECFRNDYTTKLDVYSFGILFNEVFSCERPWCHIDTQWNSEIHNRVDNGERPRFNFTKEECPHKEEIEDIISQCWIGDPNQRPDMKAILRQIEELVVKVDSTPVAPRAASTPATGLYASYQPQSSFTPNPAPSRLYGTAQPGYTPTQGSNTYASQPGGSQYISQPGAPSQYVPGGLYVSTANSYPSVPQREPSFVIGKRPEPVQQNSGVEIADALVSFLQQSGGASPIPAVDNFLQQFTNSQSAAVFANHLSGTFARRSPPGMVTIDNVSFMRLWFFPIGKEEVASSDPAQCLYESADVFYEDPKAQSSFCSEWTISKINSILALPYFKAFMDGGAVGRYLSERGTKPGQYLVRFSGSEPGKVAVSVLDPNMRVWHWKITLEAGGRVRQGTTAFDDMHSWLRYHQTNPLPTSDQNR